MSDKVYERFGKYLVLDHLVDGGMAKISRARFLGEQANKLMAIKMVQAQFSKDPDFVRMFEDELKVCFGLQHPNIAQTYDYGKVNDQLYTAMELIEGANLKEYLDRLAEKKFVFPVEISVYIISQVCQGLHYAHNYKDPLTGQPLNIVHRDISPHNVMLSYDGSVKVIDFGIAKAESNSEATQAGTIKGKLSYLAPEYLEGLTLDHRYDQFAVGITLWELLCSRRLFTAKNDLAVLKLIQQCKVPPPSSINKRVPKELDQIVLKALDKDRTLRYEDMDKLNRALVRFLYAQYPDFNATDLCYFASELFKEEIEANKKKYAEYGQIDIKPFLEDLKKKGEHSSSSSSEAPAAAAPQDFVKEQPQEFELNADMESLDELVESGPIVEKTRKVQRDRSQSRRIQRNTKTNTSIRNPNLRSSGTRTSIKRQQLQKSSKKADSGSGSMGKVAIGVVASLAAVIYFKADMVRDLTGIDLGFGGSDVAHVQPKIRPARNTASVSRKGAISFSGLDPYMELYVNENKITYTGSELTVPLNKAVTIMVKKKGYLPFYKKVMLSAGRPSLAVSIPQLEVARIGLLSTSMNYNGSKMKITINGEEQMKTLPVNNLRVPAGSYQATIINEVLGTEKTVEFEIKENKKFFLD